ncbi:MAG: ATP-grasp domain-containing protein [Anaerolineae bacterium]|nr:ATP-grasp domain-containing protein [Anaerolineae bacterium]MCO5204062.1 ATP-grasp domain-containing protein [Anaerolineae bacterium]
MSLPEKQVNILFTSVGRRVELLRAFRHAYQMLNLEGHIVAIDIEPLAPALREVDRPYIVPRLSADDFLPTLLEICRRESIDVIFPLIDHDMPVLARHRTAIETTGTRLAVAPEEAIRISADKWLTTQFFNQVGVPTPQTWLPDQLNWESLSYPLFIKPRHGSASQNTFRVDTRTELEFFVNYINKPIIQAYLSGAEITNDVICDLESNVLGVVSRRRIEVRGGEVNKGVTIYDPNITEACIRIAQSLHAIGPITVQCILKDGKPFFTEINARLGGGIPLGIAAGAHSPYWLLATIAGIPVNIPPIGTYQTGLYLSRFDDSFFITENDRKDMASRRL